MSTQVLAKALAPQVQVNEIVLGPVLPPEDYDAQALQRATEATPLQRLGQPAEVIRIISARKADRAERAVYDERWRR